MADDQGSTRGERRRPGWAAPGSSGEHLRGRKSRWERRKET
jgi:hypothetical protein